MSTQSEGGHPTVVEALHAELQSLQEAEENARTAAAEAKAILESKKAHRRRIERALQLFSDEPSEAITKSSLKPLLAQVLQKGPLQEDELKRRLKVTLKDQCKSTSGLGLMMSKLRASYANGEGQWALPDTQAPGPRVRAES